MQGDLDNAGPGVDDRIRQALADMEERDFERVDPPDGLWGRIEAAVASDSGLAPKQPPLHEAGAGTVVEYWIDANDVVADVGQDWADFARDNDASDLAAAEPDRTLWTYFGSDEIRELWQRLVERVRDMQRPAEIPLRCDAPDVRRWFTMTITPGPDSSVHFRCVLAFEEARPPVSLLDPHSDRDDDLQPVLLCGWCGRGEHGGLWLDIEELVASARLLERTSMPPISHGICGTCREEMSAELLVPGRAGESLA